MGHWYLREQGLFQKGVEHGSGAAHVWLYAVVVSGSECLCLCVSLWCGVGPARVQPGAEVQPWGSPGPGSAAHVVPGWRRCFTPADPSSPGRAPRASPVLL